MSVDSLMMDRPQFSQKQKTFCVYFPKLHSKEEYFFAIFVITFSLLSSFLGKMQKFDRAETEVENFLSFQSTKISTSSLGL